MSGSVLKLDETLQRGRSKMQILGISGSPRRGGNADLVLEAILSGASETGADTEILYLSDMEMSSCVGCERCRKDKVFTRFEDDLTPVYPRISRAEGVVLVTPVYNYNVTAWMKAFIDRLYCFYDFDNEHPRGWSSRLADQGKSAILGIVAEQVDPKDFGVTLEAMRMPMEALGYSISGELAVPGVFEAGVVGDRPEVLGQAAGLGRDLAAALRP
jgi:putative NADPH-quinone reductase